MAESPPPPPLAPPRHEEAAVAAPPPPPEAPERRRRSRWPWVAALIALLAAGGIVAGVLLLTHEGSAQTTVLPVVGEQVDTARTVLQNAGFTVNVVYEHSTRQANFVFAQDPVGGTKVDQGSTVQLAVSSGPGPVRAPNLVGETLSQAQQDLAKAGLKGRVVEQSNSQIAANTVFNQTPGSGESVPPGSTVTVFVSSGKVAMPGVNGETTGQAKADLSKAGFNNVITTNQSSTTATPGTVISQDPSGGTQADPSTTTVSLVIAQAPTVPNVVGLTGQAASSKLQGAGFSVNQQTQAVTGKKKDGIVLSQNPSPGASASQGSAVTITVGQFTPPTTPTDTTTTPTTGH